MSWSRGISGGISGAGAGSAFGPWGSAIGAGIGALSGLFGDDPYESAEDANRRAWEQAQAYEKPYWQHGLDQYGMLSDAEKSLLNPEELQNKWASGYEQSPYAKRMLDMNKASGLNLASSMGLMGASPMLSNIQTKAGDIVSKDRQQYLDDLMTKYMKGIGIGRDIYETGAQMGSRLGEQAMGYGENMGSLAYGKNNQLQNMLMEMMKANMSGGGGFSGFGGGSEMPPYAQSALYG